MLFNFMAGLFLLLLCLFLQSAIIALCLRRYVRFMSSHRDVTLSKIESVSILMSVMVVMQIGHFLQMAIWAVLFMILGEFSYFPTAMYHSGVNFTSLGYGDIVMSADRQLLGPLEAANGVLMLGLSTAVITGAVLDILKRSRADGAGMLPGDQPLPHVAAADTAPEATVGQDR